MLVQVWLFWAGEQQDSQRFQSQAEWLFNGQGFRWHDELCAYLPPGYPAFLAVLRLIADSQALVRRVQFVLSVLSCVLIWDALRHRGPYTQFVGAGLMALAPFVAHRSGYVMSETLAVFLMSVYVWSLCRIAHGASRIASFSAGIFGMALVLTAPATLFIVASGLTLAIVTLLRSQLRKAIPVLVGSAFVMFPWQIHCINATGHVVPTVYEFDELFSGSPGYKKWVRTWLLYPDEVRAAYFWRRNLGWCDRIPDRAFQSPQQRVDCRRLFQLKFDDSISDSAFDEAFGKLAAERMQERPVVCLIGYPLVRSVLVWTMMDTRRSEWRDVIGGPIRPEYFGRIDTKTGLLSTYVIVVHVFTLLVFGLLSCRAILSRHPMAIAILFGVIAYSVAGGVTATHEVRRNVVFYPALIALLGIYTRRNSKPDDEKLQRQEVTEAVNMKEPVRLEAVSNLSPDTPWPVVESEKPATECPAIQSTPTPGISY